ncbi:MAG: formate dehydrogenase subunit alpha [Chloroflexi bacterium]|nr:formate dehydrogenase subunit alpha [Chloroflexota bacterium]
MATVTITINRRKMSAEKGATVLGAAQKGNIYIPSLCSYPELLAQAEKEPDMACQLCLAQVNGKVALACTTEVADGMKVSTNTRRIRELRQKNLAALLRRHAPERITGELKRAVDYIGLAKLPPYIDKKLIVREDSPFFLRDNNLCILCKRCVRVCDDIRGARAIEFAYPCHKACPAGIDIPRYLRAIARGKPSVSLAVIRERVPFPGVLGRVCIHPCEQACQRGLEVDKPLQIRMLKWFAADNSDDSWKNQVKKAVSTGRRVAVVGSGPAGLTVAYYLARQGHGVTIFEALSRAGGMMMVGIPEYRLPRNVLDDEINEIRNAGVDIRLNTRVSSVDFLFAQGYDAVFLGLGAHQGMRLGIDGENLPGVVEAVEFLRRGNLGERVSIGKRVGVVGGGNVAIDAARLALRLGAEKVTMFYRRTREEMPASAEEIEAALEEGIEIVYLVAPSKVTRDGDTLKFECTRMRLGEPDASGRARPIAIPASEFVTDLDNLLVAIGQRPDVPAELQVAVERGNIVKVDGSMMTSRAGVFSGGDCVSGPASVIEAIAHGRKAAEAIDRFLGGRGDISESLVPPEEATTWLKGDSPDEAYASTAHLPVGTRIKNFNEVEQPWERKTAVAEAQRCLRCYVIAPSANMNTLKEANCQFCGACVDSCPTGALVERSFAAAGMVAPDRVVTTICPYCGVGCQLHLEIKNERIIRVMPDRNGPANQGQLCVKGKFGLDFVHDPARLTTPLIRKNGQLVEASWEEALDLVARTLSKYKGDELGVISSAKCTNEENYIIQRFARAVLGTNNVDHCARLCHSPSVAGLLQSFGSGAMTNSSNEFRDSACIFAIGTNTSAAHPVLWLDVKRGVKRGAKLIVANPRQIPLCNYATIWLQQRPGTDIALLNGMARVILDEGLADLAFIEKRCENFDAFKASLADYDLDTVERITGVPKDKIAAAARLYATSRPSSTIYAMGITQHTHGTDNVMAVANLAMLTGQIGKPSSGVNPLRGQNNVQGSCDMGALPNVYTGYQSVADQAIRARFEAAWGCHLPEKPGLTLTEIFDKAHQHQIKALYLVGENPVLADASAKHVEEALMETEFLVVQDIFMSETAGFAHVVLPAASFAEKEGTFTNTERRIQRVRQAFSPVGNSKADWWITCEIARRMGAKGFDFTDAAQIMDEIARVTPSYGGISFRRLEKESLQWPCPTPEHPGTPILHTQQFTRGKGKFIALAYRPPAELPDDEYPFLLTTERSLYQYHTGTMSRKAKGLNAIRPEELLEINPADATRLGIVDGEVVKVSSRRGEVRVRAKVTEASPAGVVSLSFHFAETPTNVLTSPALDPISKMPEFKVCAVKVAKVSKPETELAAVGGS